MSGFNTLVNSNVVAGFVDEIGEKNVEMFLEIINTWSREAIDAYWTSQVVFAAS